jgi:hypothetical protein
VTIDLQMEPAVAARFRAAGTPELPEDFQAVTRANATWMWEAAGDRFDPAAWARFTQEPRGRRGRPSGTASRPAAAAVAGRLFQAQAELLGRTDGPEFRAWLVGRHALHTHPRAGRRLAMDSGGGGRFLPAGRLTAVPLREAKS